MLTEGLYFLFLLAAVGVDVWSCLLPLILCAIHSTISTPRRRMVLCLAKQAWVFILGPGARTLLTLALFNAI
jgi:hypothetical protein